MSKEQYLSYKQRYENDISDLEEKCLEVEQEINEIENAKKGVFNKKEILEKYTHIDKLTCEIAEEFIDVVYIGEKQQGHEREITINWKL